MNYLLYFLQIIIIQYTSALVLTPGGRNFLNNQNCANLPTNYANNAMLSNIGQGYELNNIVATPSNIAQQDDLNANYGNIANNNIGLASGNIGGNIGSETVVYKSVPMYANVVKPPREYGIEFSSGALQVGGNVEVNGRMPFNANVSINGPVPSQGQGAVNYSCDQMNNEES